MMGLTSWLTGGMGRYAFHKILALVLRARALARSHQEERGLGLLITGVPSGGNY